MQKTATRITSESEVGFGNSKPRFSGADSRSSEASGLWPKVYERLLVAIIGKDRGGAAPTRSAVYMHFDSNISGFSSRQAQRAQLGG